MLSYLALGDSYTIGEAVPKEESFPLQLAKALLKKGFTHAPPEVVATTGWTTDELAAAIRDRDLACVYSVVTLLIGVNNQYRGRSIENYRTEFTELLHQAIEFAGEKPEHVIVLSIPDWGVTPFAEGRDRQSIAHEIDAFNLAAQTIAQAHACQWLDITDSTRKNGQNSEYLAEDGLHPSGKEYTIWAQRLEPIVEKILRDTDYYIAP